MHLEEPTDNMEQPLDISADKLLTLWSSKKFSLFLIFKYPGDSGGSTACVIDDFSGERLGLSWPGETELQRRGEIVISLKGSSRTISDIDVLELVSGADFINPSEAFVLITLPSGARFWLVMMRPQDLEEP